MTTVVTPTDTKITCWFNGLYPSERQTLELSSDTATRSLSVEVSAKFSRSGSSTGSKHTLGGMIWVATKANFSDKKVYKRNLKTNTLANDSVVAGFRLNSLRPNTKYYVKFFSVADGKNYNGSGTGKVTPSKLTTFWSNRDALAPVIVTPAPDIQHVNGASIPFQITPSDPDDTGSTGRYGEDYVGFEVYYRRTSLLGVPVNSQWKFWFGNVPKSSPDLCNDADSPYANVGKAATSPANTDLPPGPYQVKVVSYGYIHVSSAKARKVQSGTYEKTRVQLGGVSSAIQGLFITGPVSLVGWPTNISPRDDVAVEPDDDGNYDVTFSWDNPAPETPEFDPCTVEFQWRVYDASDWNTIYRTSFTDTTFNSIEQGIVLDPYTHYEWRVRTSEDGCGPNGASNYSIPTSFWTVPAPESGPVLTPEDDSVPAPALGCGENFAYVFDRGGEQLRGKITQTTQIKWSRKRDDISTATIQVSGWDADCGALLASLRSWQHEIVIFRDGPTGRERVWEGPITRVTYSPDAVEIEARDVMAYVYRRILRIGFNDAYPRLKGVVTRAKELIQNGMVYDDPNILRYLSPRESDADAQSSRVVKAYSNTVWGIVDDMAAKSGLDYVTVGRRIILWDTHNQIGLLPEMKDGDFSDPPVVTEYGMQLANLYAVTNGTDIYGTAMRGFDGDEPLYYGYIEMLSSSYGESDAGSTETLLGEAREKAIEKLNSQAERNIDNRWPTPLVVRVPDNTTLSPTLNVGINQLIPGVWIPLRANTVLRPVVQVQKLDYVEVTQNGSGEQGSEKVAIIMSPKPASGDDDDDEGLEEG